MKPNLELAKRWWLLQCLLIGSISLEVSSLTCTKCGTLATRARDIRDCVTGETELEVCQSHEVCVSFKRLYKTGSASVRGCYPLNKSLPGLRGNQLRSQRTCHFTPRDRSPIKVCVCDRDFCNDFEYDIHLKRAKNLFSEVVRQQQRVGLRSQQQQQQRVLLNGVLINNDLSSAVKEIDGLASWNLEQEIEEATYYENPREVENLSLRRNPRQIGQDGDKQIECYSCGSLFNPGDKETCSVFDINDKSQRKFCRSGQACLLYTWKKSPTQRGFFRECFDTSIRLGLASNPVNVSEKCVMERTQADPASTIRACLCTTDLCNDFQADDDNSIDDVALESNLADFLRQLRQHFRSNGHRHTFLNFLRTPPRQKTIGTSSNSTQTRRNLPKTFLAIPTSQTPLTTGHEAALRRDFRPIFSNAELNQDEATDCEWSEYGEWSECSRSCGGGFQSRERHIKLLARRGGVPCEGSNRQTRFCNRHRCPQAINDISGNGRVICPNLNVLGATYANCDGKYAYVPNLSVPWAPNRPVYKHLTRDRYIFWNAGGLGWSIGKKDYLTTGSHWHRSGLNSDEPWQGRWERGVLIECEGTNQKEDGSPAEGPTDCVWSSYGDWSSCSVSCGRGTQRRKRMQLQEARNGGRPCRGQTTETRACQAAPCPPARVDCEWSRFDSWSSCSATCGGGIQTRRRSVLQEAEGGGRNCLGRAEETRICNEGSCSKDCKWSEFGEWTSCSQSCGNGIQARKRVVLQEAEGTEGRPCEGKSTEIRTCSLATCPRSTSKTTTTTSTTTTTTTSTTEKQTTQSTTSASTETPITLSTETFSQTTLIVQLALNNSRIKSEMDSRPSTKDRDPVTTSALTQILVTTEQTLLTDEKLTMRHTTLPIIENPTTNDLKDTTEEDLTIVTTLKTAAPKTTATVAVTTATSASAPLDENIAQVEFIQDRDCVWSAFNAWSTCSKPCGVGIRTRSRSILQPVSGNGRPCRESAYQTQICNRFECGTEECCNKVVVKAARAAKRDQSLYLGTYRKISNYNGKSAYKKEGRDQLYIYFYSSPSDNLNLWVMGPKLGEFIAGIRSENGPPCVHDPDTKWLYASRSSVWKGDDPTLLVKCFSPEDEIDSPVFGAKKTSTKLKVSDEDKTNRRTTTSRPRTRTTRPPPVDCLWSDFGTWGPCSRSCNTGVQSRTRKILRQAANGGKRCLGTRQESRTCNLQRCSQPTTRRPFRPPTTTRRTTSTTTTTTTTRPARRPPPPRARSDRVQCYSCGSLFSTEAPDCPNFNSRDVTQQKTCAEGEACLWYSYQKSNSETAIIRECFSTSVLLGDITNPIRLQEHCVPAQVEEASIMACICTNDFCNGMDGGDAVIRSTPRPKATIPTRRLSISNQPKTLAPNRSPKPKPSPVPPPQPGEGVLCHQCGSLFGNKECLSFDASNSSQQGRCKQGEACLWYSWEKSSTDVAMIRECFSTSILLGPITNPLTPKSTCQPQEISETPGSSILACLCQNNLCNSVERRPGGASSTPEEPRRPAGLPNRNSFNIDKNSLPEEDDDDDEVFKVLSRVNEIGNRVTEKPSRNRVQPSPSRSPSRRPTLPPKRARPTTSKPVSSNDAFNALNTGGQKCFSCGSLLDSSRKCDKFNPTDPSQVQTCSSNEACLLYTWKKSATETAAIRECFPKSVLLGDVTNPLLPTEACNVRDISEPGNTGINACLCTTNFCNNFNGSRGSLPEQGPAIQTNLPPPRRPTSAEQSPSRRQQQNRNDPVAKPLKKEPTSNRRRRPTSPSVCPSPFVKLSTGCYFFSRERMGWIEAKKHCELMTTGNARLVAIETPGEREVLLKHITKLSRSRYEYWTAGNDIDRENEWVWSESGGSHQQVPDFGWIEQPLPSAEENCMTWSITVSRRSARMSEGWHSDSCCNNIRFICEL